MAAFLPDATATRPFIQLSNSQRSAFLVIPAKAGIHNPCLSISLHRCLWIPAFAGTTQGEKPPLRRPCCLRRGRRRHPSPLSHSRVHDRKKTTSPLGTHMIRWTPKTSAEPPRQRWQSRTEILKSALASDFDAELLRLRRELELVKREYYAHKGRFNPHQPRVPAGNSDGGQWTSDGVNASLQEFSSQGRQAAPYPLAASGKQSAAYCWNQMQIDFLLCDSLRPRFLIGACRSQAMERYAACLFLHSGNRDVEIPVRIRAPEKAEVDWICRFEIGWPEGKAERWGTGVDAAQALVMAAANDRCRNLHQSSSRVGPPSLACGWRRLWIPCLE